MLCTFQYLCNLQHIFTELHVNLFQVNQVPAFSQISLLQSSGEMYTSIMPSELCVIIMCQHVAHPPLGECSLVSSQCWMPKEVSWSSFWKRSTRSLLKLSEMPTPLYQEHWYEHHCMVNVTSTASLCVSLRL